MANSLNRLPIITDAPRNGAHHVMAASCLASLLQPSAFVTGDGDRGPRCWRWATCLSTSKRHSRQRPSHHNSTPATPLPDFHCYSLCPRRRPPSIPSPSPTPIPTRAPPIQPSTRTNTIAANSLADIHEFSRTATTSPHSHTNGGDCVPDGNANAHTSYPRTPCPPPHGWVEPIQSTSRRHPGLAGLALSTRPFLS